MWHTSYGNIDARMIGNVTKQHATSTPVDERFPTSNFKCNPTMGPTYCASKGLVDFYRPAMDTDEADPSHPVPDEIARSEADPPPGPCEATPSLGPLVKQTTADLCDGNNQCG